MQTIWLKRRLPMLLLLALAPIGCGRFSRPGEAAFLKKGHERLAEKDYSRALLEFKNAAAAAPKDGEPYYQIGLIYLRSGDYRSAIDSFRRCMDRNPQHAGARLKTAELMTSSTNPETLAKAATQLRELLDDSPQNVEASDALAMTEWRLGNREEAIERLQKVLRDFPASLSSSVFLARIKLSQNDFQAAEEVLRSASAKAPQSSETALALGEMYLITGQIPKAEPEIARAIQLNGNNGQALLALAAIQSSTSRWDAAEETYRRISALADSQYKPLHALFLFQHGKREQGFAELRELAGKDPSDRIARTRLIAACLETGNTSEAHKLLAAALDKNTKDTDALMQRSALYLLAGKANDAQRDLEQVLHFHPDNADAHRAIAKSYKIQGQWQSERRELIEAVRLRRELLSARLPLARNYINANEPKTALQILDEAPPAQQTLLPVLIERNWALLATSDLALLRTNLDAALQAGRHPALVLQQALMQMAGGHYEQARASAEEVLKSDPRDLGAARIVVDSYMAQHQPAKALDRLKELAKASPESARLQHMLGMWQLAAGDIVSAREQFERAKRADPGLTDADIALADIDRRQDRPEASRKRLQEVIARQPSNLSALLLSAEIEKSSGNQVEAVARYRAVLAIDPSNLAALNNISNQLIRSNPDEALGFAQRALEIAPDNPAVQDTLGWIYYRKGIYLSAVQHLKAAVAKEPNPERQFHLALSYIKSGETVTGQEMLRSAIRQDPSLSGMVQER